MNFTDLKQKTEDELKAELVKLKKEQFNLSSKKRYSSCSYRIV